MTVSAAEHHNLSHALLDAVGASSVPPLECEGSRLDQSEFARQLALRQSAWKARPPARGERVLVATGRGNDVWLDIAALWALGSTAVPMEPHADARQLDAVMAAANPTHRIGAFASPASPVMALPALPAISNALQGSTQRLELAAVAPDHEAMILFTSGSTGQPKGVPLTHGALLGNARSTKQCIGLGAGRRLFMPIPFRFISAISHFLVTLLCGSTLVGTERKLIQASLVESLLEADADAFGGAPVQARWIAQASDTIGTRLTWLMSSGDHLPVSVIAELRAAMPRLQIHTVYGLTELAGRFCTLPPDRLDTAAGSVGRPIPGLNVTVAKEDGQPAAPGEDGQIWAGGKLTFDGYLNAPEVNARCLGSLGFNTGDIGHQDQDGWLYLTGRSDDVFKSAGLKVSTVEVSAALMETGMFTDVAVVPWDATGIGTIPYACVVMKPTTVFHKGQVIRALRERLPGHCIPRHYREMKEIPRTGSGKVRRGVLKELLATA